MKVLVETFNIVESGPVLAHDIANALKKNGIDVSCVVCSNIENIDDWKRDFNTKNIFLWRLYKNKVLNIIFNVFNLKKKFRSEFFDYIIYTNPTRRDALAGKFLKYKENIYILHDVIPHSSTDLFTTEYVDSIMKTADNILILSNGYRELVKKRYGLDDNHVLYMRHGLMKYPLYDGKINEADYNMTNFLFFGRIDGYKGLHILAKAYAKLENISDVSLTIAGNGDFSDFKDDYLGLKNVTIINKYIDDSEIAMLFSKPNTIVVLPYLDATQSGVIGMAFNYECPIIASDTGGIKEQLFNGEVGVLAKPGDEDDLSIKMREFIDNKDKYFNEKDKIKKYKEKMSWEYITKDLIKQLLEKSIL